MNFNLVLQPQFMMMIQPSKTFHMESAQILRRKCGNNVEGKNLCGIHTDIGASFPREKSVSKSVWIPHKYWSMISAQKKRVQIRMDSRWHFPRGFHRENSLPSFSFAWPVTAPPGRCRHVSARRCLRLQYFCPRVAVSSLACWYLVDNNPFSLNYN